MAIVHSQGAFIEHPRETEFCIVITITELSIIITVEITISFWLNRAVVNVNRTCLEEKVKGNNILRSEMGIYLRTEVSLVL